MCVCVVVEFDVKDQKFIFDISVCKTPFERLATKFARYKLAGVFHICMQKYYWILISFLLFFNEWFLYLDLDLVLQDFVFF